MTEQEYAKMTNRELIEAYVTYTSQIEFEKISMVLASRCFYDIAQDKG